MSQIKQELQQFKKEFDPLLFAFLKRKQKEIKQVSAKTEILIKEIIRTNKAGGKRLRPALVFYAFKAGGGKKDKEALNLGIALEIFHTFCLIHDDILDKADKRRREAAVFKKYGLETALLAGDLALILAHSLVKKEKIRELFVLLNQEVALGEYLDVTYSTPKKRASQELIVKIMEYKTARYTFARPLQLGATLAEASPKVLKAFWQYGLNLGLAFQIQDDILGVFGKEEKLGKSVLSDMREAKQTLLLYQTLNLINKPEKIKFLKLWGNKQAARKDLAWLKDLMISSGALATVKKQARNYALKAKQNLLKLDIQKKDFFINLADFIIEREF